MKEKILHYKNNFFTVEKAVLLLKYVVLFLVGIYLWMFIGKHRGYVRFHKDGTINRTTVIYAIMVIAVAGMTVIASFLKNKLSDRINRMFSYVIFILSPVICYFLVEEFHHNKFDIEISNISPFYISLNILILFVILLALLVLTNNIKFSVIGLCLITSGFGIINYYVYSFRGIAIVASDIYSVETAASVAGDYKLFSDFNIYFIGITTLFFITLVSKLRNCSVFPNIKGRVIAFGAYLLLFLGFVHVFVFSNQLSQWNIDVKLFRPHKAYKTYGSILSTVRTMGYIIVDKPKGYSSSSIEELASQYVVKENEGQKPNIIVVMNEAFSDLKSINDFQTNEDYMPFIRSLTENTIKGSVYVSSFGGNTANTEFEFLTGNSMAFLPANAVPYQLFIKDKFPSLAYQLEAQDYKGNIALHPYHPNGYNRKKVYPLMGFEDFITVEDFEKDRLLRTRIPDEVNFERIIEEYEASKSRSQDPFFLFNVTMQNHSGYKVTDPNFITKITIEDEEYYDEYTQNYLSLIKYTDEAVEKMITYFESVKEPTVIIFFGDHQPGLSQSWYDKLLGGSEEDLSVEELMVKYQTPFFAWANFDIPEENVDKISMNYLAAYLMDKVGVNLTKYQQYLLEVQKEVPAMNSLGYFGADGNFYDYEDTDSAYFELLDEYRNVQYNDMHDKGNRVDDMFYINKN